MNAQETRHIIEYEWIPEMVYSDAATYFVATVLQRRQELIIDMYKMHNQGVPGYQCPYTVNDYNIDAVLIGDIAGIIRLMMPPVLADGDITRMYICHDEKLGRVRLYTIMIDSEGDTCFMTWLDDSHYKNHGKFRLSESQEMQTVQSFYLKYLKGN